MNLTLHIVRKDLVRMRAWIACWIALLLVPMAVGWWVIGHNQLGVRDWHLPEKIAIFTLVEVLVGYLLTILILHEDPVVGTQQFWLTRPISRGRMLQAKMLSAFVIVGLVPILVSVPWWWWCGFELGQMLHAAMETWVILMIAMLPAAVVAVLTDSLPRALLWTVALVALIAFGAFFFGTALAVTTTNRISEAHLIISRALIAVVGVAVEMGALAVLQFLVPRRGWWTLAMAGLIIITAIGALSWDRPLLSPYPKEHHVEKANGMTMEFAYAGIADVTPRVTGRRNLYVPDLRLESRFVVKRPDRDLALVGGPALQRWTWSEGMRLERTDTIYAMSEPDTRFGLKATAQASGWRRSWLRERMHRTLAANEDPAFASTLIPRSIGARMQKDPPKFEGRFWFRLLRPELRVEIPLAPHAWTARHGHGLGIESVEKPDGSTLNLVMVATQPLVLSSLLDDFPHGLDLSGRQRWALVDRERGYYLAEFDEGGGERPRSVVINGVRIVWRHYEQAAWNTRRDGKVIPWNWGTSLATITMHEEAVFSREVKVDPYEPGK